MDKPDTDDKASGAVDLEALARSVGNDVTRQYHRQQRELAKIQRSFASLTPKQMSLAVNAAIVQQLTDGTQTAMQFSDEADEIG